MSDLTNVASEPVSNNAFVLIQVTLLFKITGIICKNAEFVNALDNTWFWIFSSDGFVIGFTGLLRLTGLKNGSRNKVRCFLLQESIRHFVVDLHSLILCPFNRQFQQSCFSLTNFFFSSKVKLFYCEKPSQNKTKRSHLWNET